VLLALSSGERRRQLNVDVHHHLLECDYCDALSEPLLRRQKREPSAETRIPIRGDADIVTARQRGRDIAAQLPFTHGELTMIATAISEVSRNIVRFSRRGEVVVSVVQEGKAQGVRVVARDAGPGIGDVELALTEGYSTYGGMGLGLPGSRRLMDDFEVTSEVGRGTTVVMTKWWRVGGPAK
jgi:serine/threonine-protein kinase RsbT